MRKIFNKSEQVRKILAVTPFNRPPYALALKNSIAIVNNNCVICKPTELTPRSTIKSAEILHYASLSVEIFKILIGWPNNIGDETVTKHNIKTVIFTGRLHLGKIIAQKARITRAAL